MELENPVPTFRFGIQNACKARENGSPHVKKRSAPTIKSFREERVPTSSTASSPAYITGDQISSSPDSFTAALKALQGRPANGWDYLSSINGVLSSKWDEAEKYICNPLSGQIPVECLSTKTLSGRALPISRRLLTKSGPLVLSKTHLVKMRANLIAYEDKDDFASPDVKDIIVRKGSDLPTRDVGVQITSLPELSSTGSNSSPDISPDSKDSSLITSSNVSQGWSFEKPNMSQQAKEKDRNKEKHGFGEERKKKKMIKWKPWSCISLGSLLWVRHKRSK